MLKKCKNIFCIGLIAVLSVMSLSVVFAEEVVEETQVIPTEEQQVYTTAYPEYTQAPEPETQAPVYTQAPEPETQAPVYTQAPEPVYTEYYTQAQEENYYFHEEPTEFQNQQENYDAETTEATEQNTSLYKDVKDIDDTELKKKNWANIVADLAKANESDKDSDASPFDYIKNGDKATGFQAFLNSLNWAMTLAIICFIIAAICVVVFIVLTKKNKQGNIQKNLEKNSPTPKRGNSKTDKNGYYIPPSQRGKSDYGDDFSADTSRYDELISPGKAVKKKKASQDTGEIIIPDNYKKR